MEFAEVVRKRRMVRSFTPEPIPMETIERIVATAQRAPSAGFSQGVSFVLVTDPTLRRRVANMAGGRVFVSAAPVQLVICTSETVYRDRYREPDKRNPYTPEGEDAPWPIPYWHIDAGCAMMLLLLAARDEGLASAFAGLWNLPGMRSLLGIPSMSRRLASSS